MYSANEAVQMLLSSCDDISMVITSRLKLGREDEQVIRLEPMSILEGVELFLQRASTSLPRLYTHRAKSNFVGQIVNVGPLTTRH